MRTETTIDIKTEFSTLWIVVMLNMIFTDIFSIMVELVNKNTLEIPGEVTTMMAIAAILMNIPIMMIYFTRKLKYKANRIANISADMLTIVYVIGGKSDTPHYIICATIEVILLIVIIVIIVIIVKAWKWKGNG
jgi:hypothetical protein